MRRPSSGGEWRTPHIPQAIAESGRLIVVGALIAGLAVGARTQTIWLTLPLLGVVLLDRTGRGGAGALLGSAMTFSIGVMAWAVPLLVASGGLAQYRAAFAGQAAEQFTGLDIFLSHPTPRRLALGIIAALVGPWAAPPLGWIVVAIAIAGLALLAWRAPLAAGLLLVAYVPYAVFHLVVQESYSRYALPIVPAVGYLVVRGLSAAGAKAAAFGSAAIVVASLVLTLPAAKAYGTYPSPVYLAISDVQKLVASSSRQCGRRASPVCPRARNERNRDDDPAVAGHARVDRPCGVLARRRERHRCGTCRTLLAATWS